MTPQPIETVPKDGTWILVWVKNYGRWMPVQWRRYGWSGHGCLFPGATHWLPMPPMPEVNEHE